jgi:NADPH:quinone reductase-like Zn-dependent oxidoreductase
MAPAKHSPSLPSAMKAIEVSEFISADLDNLVKAMTMNHSAEIPQLKPRELLIKVHACSLSPGDLLMVEGNMVFMHPSKFPFVPGMDVTGEIANANGSANFKVGDMVVAANGTLPIGGTAEYMAIQEEEAVLMPNENVSTVEAAASSSAITARNAVMENVTTGNRVLILGGSGGVGSAAIQIAKNHAGASFVATTSTQDEFCRSLGADAVVNYREENWWEKHWNGELFDVIIDTVGGGNFTNKANLVLKSGRQGGKFVAITGDNPKPDCSTWPKAIQFFASLFGRPLYTWMHKSTLPSYTLLMPHNFAQGRKEVLDWMSNQSLDVVLDKKSPLPFTEEGVREAFRTVASGHAHGKVVVSIAI